MIHRGLIFVWRILVLCAVGALTYITAFFIFPFIGHHTPLVLAILLCYGLLAYAIIPLIIRLLRLILKPNHVPTHCNTGDGWPSDPINIAVTVKSRRHFTRVMQRSGWYNADKKTIANDLREFWALIMNRPYPQAPCSNLYLFNRSQDLTFEMPVGNSPRIRHHVRFWQVRADQKLAYHIFWFNKLRKLIGLERELWVGAATFDKHMFGMKWRTLQFNHHIDKDTNKERDFVMHSLRTAGFLKRQHEVKAGESYRFRGQNFGTTITSDGYITLCELRLLATPVQHRTNHSGSNHTDTK